MRRKAVLLAVAGTACAVASLPGIVGADQDRPRCRQPNARVELENRWVLVQSRKLGTGRGFSVCYRPRADAYELSDPGFEEHVFPPPALALSSATVAYGIDGLTEDGPASYFSTRLIVLRYDRNHPHKNETGWRVLTSARAGVKRESKVGSIAVRPSGAVAWISCPMKGEPRSSSAPSCKQPGFKNAVWRIRSKNLKTNQQSGKRDLLDSGHGIDPASMQRIGERVYWIKNGERRSASLK